MVELETGHVIWIKFRFNNSGDVSTVKHPYLVAEIDRTLNVVELIQLDSLQGKEFKALMRSNKVIYADNPPETVIQKDSFAQLDNLFKMEFRAELVDFRRTSDTLSTEKLREVLAAYRSYHDLHQIDEDKIVYMDWEEFTALN